MLGDPEPPSDRYADLPPVAVDVPDDARELARDLQALQRERRSARRRTWVQRHLPGRRWHRCGIAPPLVVTALLFVALGTTLLAVLAYGRPARPTPRPLASQVPVAPGTEGGLLPAVPLRLVDGARGDDDGPSLQLAGLHLAISVHGFGQREGGDARAEPSTGAKNQHLL